jgi:hypothetical protein
MLWVGLEVPANHCYSSPDACSYVEMLARPAIAQRTHSSSSTSQYDFAPVRAYINKTIAEKLSA